MNSFLFFRESLGKSLVGVNVQRALVGVYHHSGLCASRLADVFDIGEVNRHKSRLPRSAVVRRKLCRLFYRPIRRLLSFTDNDGVRAGHIQRVKPDVVIPALPEGQTVVLPVVATDKNEKSVVRTEPQRGQLGRLLARRGLFSFDNSKLK